jgi:hypothetical protein
MKKHLPLPIPSDNAWGRKTWRYYAPIWLTQFIDGILNLIKWAPTIYKDRNWDDYYIFEILKFKLIQQRKELVEANRHTGIEETNRYITICLNLIEHIQEETYNLEYQDFVREKVWFSKNNNSELTSTGITYTYNSEIEIENFSGYFKRYPNQVKKLLNKEPELSLPDNKMKLALKLGDLNQSRCQTLLFKILDNKINHWWD